MTIVGAIFAGLAISIVAMAALRLSVWALQEYFGLTFDDAALTVIIVLGLAIAIALTIVLYNFYPPPPISPEAPPAAARSSRSRVGLTRSLLPPVVCDSRAAAPWASSALPPLFRPDEVNA